jgi:diguanylate cyclase
MSLSCAGVGGQCQDGLNDTMMDPASPSSIAEQMSNLSFVTGLVLAFFAGATIGWFAWRKRIERVVDVRTLEAQNRELNAVRVELEMANERLRQLTIVDPLTGISNRRAFDQALGHEVRCARREGRQLSLILCDIDGFKAFNDHYGHSRGDETLRQVAQVVALTFRRAGDLAARYGGEEFAVILPGVPARRAVLYAERLRRNVWRQGIQHEHAPVGARISLSAGVASLELIAYGSAESLLKAADEAMYRAKSAGRNRVALAARVDGSEKKLERAS